jgi:hypothetical protein
MIILEKDYKSISPKNNLHANEFLNEFFCNLFF